MAEHSPVPEPRAALRARLEAAMRSTGLGVSDQQVDVTLAEVEAILTERTAATRFVCEQALAERSVEDALADGDTGPFVAEAVLIVSDCAPQPRP